MAPVLLSHREPPTPLNLRSSQSNVHNHASSPIQSVHRWISQVSRCLPWSMVAGFPERRAKEGSQWTRCVTSGTLSSSRWKGRGLRWRLRYHTLRGFTP